MKKRKTPLEALIDQRKNRESVQAQARIDKDLYDRVNQQRIKDGLSWPDLFELYFNTYLNDRGYIHSSKDS